MENSRPIYSLFALLLFKLQWLRFQAMMRKYDRHVIAPESTATFVKL